MQLVILFVVLVFADGTVKTSAEAYPSADTCKHVEAMYWSQPAEIYAKANLASMFTECLNIVPREV